MTQPVSNSNYTVGTGTNSNAVFINVVETRNPSPNDINYPIQKRWINSLTTQEFILIGLTCSGGVVQANWDLLNGGTAGNVSTLEGNTGGFIDPTGGNISVVGDNSTISITGNAAASSLTAKVLLPAQAHQVLVGEISTINGIAPSATSGIPLISQGVSADPTYGMAEVLGGGTGRNSFVSFALVAGGSSSTSFLQQVPSVGTSGEVLTSNGIGNLPTFKPVSTTGGFAWSDASGSFTAVIGHGYFITATATASLPTAPTDGDAVAFIVDTGDVFTIQSSSSNFIRINAQISDANGSATNTNIGDTITLFYRSGSTSWISLENTNVWILTT